MKMLRTLGRFASEMIATSPRKAAASAALMVAMSFTEGLGLLLLLPLLQLAGVNEPDSTPAAAGWFDAALAATGVKPTLPSVLLLFVSIAAFRALFDRWQSRPDAAVRQGFTASLRARGVSFEQIVGVASVNYVSLKALLTSPRCRRLRSTESWASRARQRRALRFVACV